MRLAGKPEVVTVLAQYAPEEAPTSAEAGMDRFFHAHALLKSKGYSEQAAQLLAAEVAAGRAPEPKSTRRFAGMYGECSP